MSAGLVDHLHAGSHHARELEDQYATSVRFRGERVLHVCRDHAS